MNRRIAGLIVIVVAVLVFILLVSFYGGEKEMALDKPQEKSATTLTALNCSLANKAAFVGENSITGVTDIFLACLESEERMKLTDGTMEVGSPSLSPDGMVVAFHGRTDENDDWDIYLYDTEISELRQITSDSAQDTFPAFSPNGNVIAFSSDRRGVDSIYLLNLDDGEKKLYKLSGTLDTQPHFSLSGTRVVFTSYNHDTENKPQIYTINVDRSEKTQLTTEGGNQFPRFSPSGQYITFISDRSANSSESARDLYLMNADGSEERQLFVSSYEEVFPSFTPDGLYIYFTLQAPDDLNSAIYRVSIAGSLPERVLEIEGLAVSDLVYPMASGALLNARK